MSQSDCPRPAGTAVQDAGAVAPVLLTLGAVLLYQRFRGEFAGRAGGDPGTKVTLTIVAESSGARLTLRVDPRYLGLIPADAAGRHQRQHRVRQQIRRVAGAV
ncbi:hypothetical protein [Mycolicibacterium diernhoferi]|uniref:hypothetical protein n=1 Tax=Mycolicibacterium diernhoferi TaxID=1801 RepID=UPI00104206F5|nr:hypothetical protein [Mycolicibacterium diernhoferi]